jgi:dihydrofolate reductase/thymidylate synthase
MDNHAGSSTASPPAPLPTFSIILTATRKGGIGAQGKLPWHLPKDLRHFRKLTCTTQDPDKQNVVIMGRNTWESLPAENRPLPHRINIIISSTMKEHPPFYYVCPTFQQALERIRDDPSFSRVERSFVIGGAQLYNEAFLHPQCEKIYWTYVILTTERERSCCDTFVARNSFKVLKRKFSFTQSLVSYYRKKEKAWFRFRVYERNKE